MMLIKRFKQNALPFVTQRPQGEWEWLFVMQHHGLPTRLLDWTESPLTALYFAVRDDPANEGADSALWALSPLELNASSRFKTAHASDIPGFGDDEHLDFYLPSKIAQQKMAYGTLAAIASRNNARIQVQQGVFTVDHTELKALDDGDPPYLWRYIIPSAAKGHIRAELTRLNIGKLTLFPELTNVAEHARGF